MTSSTSTAIRYWTDYDQFNPRRITFNTYAKALDMLTFYKGAGIRCELLPPGLWQFNMCHNLPRIGYKSPYNSIIQKDFKHVQQRSNTSLQRTSPSKQISDERSSSSGSTRSNGSEKLWTTANTSRQLEHIWQTLSSNSQGAVKCPLEHLFPARSCTIIYRKCYKSFVASLELANLLCSFTMCYRNDSVY